MKTWTIRRRLLGSFAIILALMMVMGGIAWTRLATIEKAATSAATDSIPGLDLSNEIAGNLIMSYALTVEQLGQADILATQKLEQRWQVNQAKFEASIRKFESRISTAEDRELFAAFKAQVAPYERFEHDILQLNADLKYKEVNEMWRDRLDPALEKARDAIQATVNLNKASAERSVEEISAAILSAKIRMLASFLLTLVFTCVGAYYLLRGISRPLKQLNDIVDVMRAGDFSTRLTLERHDEFHVLADGFNRMTDELTALVGQVQKSSSQVNTSVTEISATTKQQQATATEIAATTTQIGATSREISATSKGLVTMMSEVAQVTERSAVLAGSGQAGLSNMEGTMGRVMEAAASINAKLAVLNEKAGNITQVVTTITKVADQTNLLSLNAAIEAEKAGEYGRGFAVVATEIRRLADQTAVATYDIEQMVKDIQSAVAAGVMGMDKFSEEVRRGIQEIQHVGGQLSQIIHEVQQLAPRVESVNEGMQAQSSGAEQISESLTLLTAAARQTVDSLNQSSAAISELNQVSSGLRNGVSRFKLQAA
ncbi:MAG: methyl-accepting chemotaxis protein [Pseudomonadota bacterium]|nr:methyl-accepting chemotaxis protein [Pseudomonadota bacterium]